MGVHVERMRVTGKWLDHAERAYRKAERPLLAKERELQQENDRLILETLRRSRLEAPNNNTSSTSRPRPVFLAC